MQAAKTLHRGSILTALLIVYLAWGSSYIAIKYGVDDVRPLEFSALRFLLLAPMMWGVSALRGVSMAVSRRDGLMLMVSSLIMLVTASGLMAWAQQWVPAGQAALLMSSSALWMVLFGGLGAGAASRRVGVRLPDVVGLLGGFVGLALLVGTGLRSGAAPWFAYLGVVASAIAWSAGSMLLRRCPVRTDPTITVAVQALLAGLVLLVLSRMEAVESTWSLSAQAALLYLLLVGSVAGYWAYYWLIDKVSPALLGTYAYANPLVAALLGFLIFGERLDALQMIGAGLIITSLLLTGTHRTS